MMLQGTEDLEANILDAQLYTPNCYAKYCVVTFFFRLCTLSLPDFQAPDSEETLAFGQGIFTMKILYARLISFNMK